MGEKGGAGGGGCLEQSCGRRGGEDDDASASLLAGTDCWQGIVVELLWQRKDVHSLLSLEEMTMLLGTMLAFVLHLETETKLEQGVHAPEHAVGAGGGIRGAEPRAVDDLVSCGAGQEEVGAVRGKFITCTREYRFAQGSILFGNLTPYFRQVSNERYGVQTQKAHLLAT